jgi:hypothetical protein
MQSPIPGLHPCSDQSQLAGQREVSQMLAIAKNLNLSLTLFAGRET